MMTTDETVSWLLARIGHVIDRPLMYGGSASGVELILHHYFELLGAVTHRHDEFEQARRAALHAEDCGSQNFAGRYHSLHPHAPEPEVADYVARQWKRIAEQLGLQVPSQPLATP